jgi:hypothetical protein
VTTGRGEVYARDGYGDGWLVYSGIALMTVAVMRVLDGIWALRYDGPVPERLQDAVLGHDLTTYGWVWIVIAVILFGAGIAVFGRSQLGRWIGIVAAAIGAISAVMWLPYYPVWSLAYILLDFSVIYGLGVHGSRAIPLQ